MNIPFLGKLGDTTLKKDPEVGVDGSEWTDVTIK